MADNALVVEAREHSGKGVARKLRAAGRIPGIYYGKQEEPQSISIDPGRLDRLISESDAGMNTLINLTIEGKSGERLALVKEIQKDPVTGVYLHADLLAVDVAQTIHVTVPIHIEGIPTGVVLGGGILDHALRELELECMPRAIPKEIPADVSSLEVGDSLHVRDLPLPEGVKLLTDPDLSVVSVAAPTVAEEAEPDAEVVEDAAAEGEAGEKADRSSAEGSKESRD